MLGMIVFVILATWRIISRCMPPDLHVEDIKSPKSCPTSPMLVVITEPPNELFWWGWGRHYKRAWVGWKNSLNNTIRIHSRIFCRENCEVDLSWIYPAELFFWLLTYEINWGCDCVWRWLFWLERLFCFPFRYRSRTSSLFVLDKPFHTDLS